MRDIHVFRVKTMFHLLQAILIVNQTDYNILFLDGKSVNKLEKKLRAGWFQEIHINKNSFSENKILRHFFTLWFSVFYRFRYFLKPKNNYILFTSSHNIIGSVYKYFFFAKEIKILEDGNYSYNMQVLNKINFLYENQNKNSIIKSLLGDYFLNIFNHNITGYYFTSRYRLKKNLFVIYNRIQKKIIEIDLVLGINKMTETKKIWIKSIFFDENFSIDKNCKTIILLTQPLNEIGLFKKHELLKLYDEYLGKFDTPDYICYLKMHPVEEYGKYDSLVKKHSLKVLPKDFPFELLELFSLKFDLGITYNSTAVFSNLITKKIILDKNQERLFSI